MFKGERVCTYVYVFVLLVCTHAFIFVHCLSLKRYYYYISKGVPKPMLEPQSQEQLHRIQKLVPEKFLLNEDQEFISSRVSLFQEIDEAYNSAMCKAIGESDFLKNFC